MLRKPRAVYVGPEAIERVLSASRPSWEFVRDTDGSAITSLEQFANLVGNQVLTADNLDIVILLDVLFDESGENTLLQEAIATMSPYCLVLVLNYRPELEVRIRQAVGQIRVSGEIEEAPFYFVSKNRPNPDIDSAIMRYVKEGGNTEKAEIILGEKIDPVFSETVENTDTGSVESLYGNTTDNRPDGTVIGITSNKGGSGKSTVATTLATWIAKSSRVGAEMGIVDRPLKVCLVDLNVKDGQLGFIVGKMSPTILQLLGAGLSEEEVDKIAIHHKALELDVFLAPNLPRYADNIQIPFYQDFINILKKKYDVVILDTAPDYIDPLIENVVYPMSNKVVFVLDYIFQAVFGMARWIREVRDEPERETPGLDMSKVGLVFNKVFEDSGLNKEVLRVATSGLPVWTIVPSDQRAVAHATNNQSIDLLVLHPKISPAFSRLASKVMPDYKFPPVAEVVKALS